MSETRFHVDLEPRKPTDAVAEPGDDDSPTDPVEAPTWGIPFHDLSIVGLVDGAGTPIDSRRYTWREATVEWQDQTDPPAQLRATLATKTDNLASKPSSGPAKSRFAMIGGLGGVAALLTAFGLLANSCSDTKTLEGERDDATAELTKLRGEVEAVEARLIASDACGAGEGLALRVENCITVIEQQRADIKAQNASFIKGNSLTDATMDLPD